MGECGNSGNSTEPHVHVQVSDRIDWDRAKVVVELGAGTGPMGSKLAGR